MMRNRSPRHSIANPAVIAAMAKKRVTIAGAKASTGTTFRIPTVAISATSRMPANNSLPRARGRPGTRSNNLTAV